MFNIHIKSAWRAVFRQKWFSVINIVGLAVALSAFFLIIQYVGFERSYDTFHEKAEQIYRVNTTRFEDGRVIYRTALSPANAGPFLKKQFEEIKTFTRLVSMQFNFVCAVSYSDDDRTTTFNERHVYYGDQDFFTVFSFPLIAGDVSTALKEPFTVVISQEAANRYFGDRNPLGQTLRFVNSSEEHEYKVTGVLGHPDGPSHLTIDFIFSYPSLTSSAFRGEAYDNWADDVMYTYIRSEAVLSDRAINDKLRLSSDAGAQLDMAMGLRPVNAIHLSGGLQDEPSPTGSRTVIDFFLVVGCFIVTLAWINYSNLATADALRRIREVGVRKIIGASRWQIVAQFAIQFTLINALALVLCCVLVPAAVPMLQEFTGVPLEFRIDGLPLLPLAGFFVVGILLSGGYPAYVLSNLNPGRSLRGTILHRPKNTLIRDLMVGFQACVSMALIIATLVVYRQLNFMQQADLGMNIDNTLVVKAPIFTDATTESRLKAFRDELLERPSVRAVTLSSTAPAGVENGWVATIRRDEDDKTGYPVEVNVVDKDFVRTFNIELMAGRDFLPSDYRTWQRFGDQTEHVIINASAAALLGFDDPEAAIDRDFFWNGGRCRVAGVVRDFHQRSLQHEVKPAVFVLDKNGTQLSIRLDASSTLSQQRAMLNYVESNFRKFFPDDPFEYFFLEELFDAQYRGEQRLTSLFTAFSTIALFTAWLGMAGLISFFLLQRRKEIGIRKVLGATVVEILKMISRNYLKSGSIALAVVIPITYYMTTVWLERYAYHIAPDVWMFVTPALGVIAITLVLVVLQSMKAAMTNPAEALRNE